MHGRILLCVGNSGAGKDSLLAYVHRQVGDELNLTFAKRWITRVQNDPNEDYMPISTSGFIQKVKSEEFFVWWEAYGYFYGIDQEVQAQLQSGRNVVMNVSRKVVEELRERFPDCIVVMVDAPKNIIVSRLAARGRCDEVEVMERLLRAESYQHFREYDILIENGREIETAAEILIEKLRTLLIPTPRLMVMVLGGAATVPMPKNPNSSFLLRHQDGDFLIDTPPGVLQMLADVDYDPENLRGIIITHDHVDHILGLAALAHYAIEREFPVQLDLFAPLQAVKTADSYLNSLREGLGSRFYLHPIPLEAGTMILDTDDLYITACPTFHSRETVAIAVQDKATGRRVVFSSDTRPSELLANFAFQADYLFHDCAGEHRYLQQFSRNHSSGRQAGEIARSANVQRLVLTHLDPRYYECDDVLKTETVEAYKGKVAIARHHQVYLA